MRCQAPKGSAVCDLLEGQANTRGGGEMWREGQEGHLQTSECSAEGAKGVESGQEARRAHQLSGPATGHTSVPLHRAGGNLTRGGQCPRRGLLPVSRQEGGGGHRAGGPAGRCQVPWEASMAPAVSWKSSSCCRKRMACIGERMGPGRSWAGARGQITSHKAPLVTIPGQVQGQESAQCKGWLQTSCFALWVGQALHVPLAISH